VRGSDEKIAAGGVDGVVGGVIRAFPRGEPVEIEFEFEVAVIFLDGGLEEFRAGGESSVEFCEGGVAGGEEERGGGEGDCGKQGGRETDGELPSD
jgi:hypothetical protein